MIDVTNQPQPHAWTFLSNHSHVLYCISSWPDIRVRDIALKVQITERAVQRIVVDLEAGGYLKRQRVGGRIITGSNRGCICDTLWNGM